MTATVEQIESWIVDVPTIRPHKLSMTTMGCQSLVIVRLTRSDGICGIGEATTIGGLSYGVESPEAISSAITHYLTPLLKGQPADNLNALTARMNGAIKGNTFAKSAIETALLDAQGKALGLPVSALLGGALQTALPVLWTLASGDTAKDIAEGEKLLAEGRHRAFKLKIGARELATDLRHTRAIVEALGDRASIRVDVNQAWDAATGAKGCRELAAMGVDLIEQPVSAHDNAALVRLSQQIETAILADEAVATAYDGYQLAQQGFTGAYALKIAKAGGAEQRAGAGPRRAGGRDWPVRRHHAGRHRRDRGFSARLVDAAAAVGYRDVRPAVAERRYCQRAAHLCRRSGGAAANAGPWRRAG